MTRARCHRGVRRPAARELAGSLLGLLLSATFVLTACGGAAGADDPAASQGDPILGFYQCLRDNGLDVADPGQGEGIALQGIDTDNPATIAVVRECAETHMSTSGGRVTVGEGNMGDRLADTGALIDFVDCMRDNGVDMADPSPEGRLPLPENVDPNSAEFQAAIRQCSQHLGGGGILIGEPGGGGMVGRGR